MLRVAGAPRCIGAPSVPSRRSLKVMRIRNPPRKSARITDGRNVMTTTPGAQCDPMPASLVFSPSSLRAAAVGDRPAPDQVTRRRGPDLRVRRSLPHPVAFPRTEQEAVFIAACMDHSRPTGEFWEQPQGEANYASLCATPLPALRLPALRTSA